MNCTIPYKYCLISRNEGKIKSYESCLDIRAWNHDMEVRGGHLRAWMKSDMPCCIIPVSTIAVALRIMSCKNRGHLTPRCRPNCKSKVVLESICTSCKSIKECIAIDPKFEKYFEEEDFETSHWPCERCLDVLKSIKMFWRIIMEKVFRISIPKDEKVPLSVRSYNLLNTTRTWQTNIVQETVFVKNMMPLLDRTEKAKTSSSQFESDDCTVKASHPFNARPIENSTYNTNSLMASESYVVIPETRHKQKVNRSISVKIKKANVGCETIHFDEGDRIQNTNNLDNMKINLDQLKADVEKLKKENMSLKIELQNVYNGCHLEPTLCTPGAPMPTHDALAYLPKPFDDEPSSTFIDDVDSEMIITMKNCRNSGYKQVSLLQVMHKSNTPFYSTQSTTDASCRREDPIHVLEKLQTTFGAMVQREVSLVGDKKSSDNPPSVVTATYQNVKVTKSRTKLGSEAKLSFVSDCDSYKDVEN